METVKRLKDLKISITDLYHETKQIRVHLSDKDYPFSVILKGFWDGQPDCKISSLGANIWFRTKRGVNKKRYSNKTELESYIIKKIKEYVDSDGEITFSLSDEIDIT